MELFLISLLVVVLFIERGGKLREQVFSAIRSNHRGVIKYFGSAAVLSLSFTLLPGILLSIYMRHNGFFAYEVFGDQHQAVQVLSINVFLNFLLMSFYLFFAAMFFVVKADGMSKFIGILVSVFIVVLFVLFAISSGRYDLVASILVFCIMLGGYLCFWGFSGFSDKARFWWVPLAFAVGFDFVPVIFFKYAAELTENALSQMKVGGIDVEISESLAFNSKSPETMMAAKLLLRTPEFCYLILENSSNEKSHSRRVLIVPSERVSLKYELK